MSAVEQMRALINAIDQGVDPFAIPCAESNRGNMLLEVQVLEGDKAPTLPEIVAEKPTAPNAGV